MKKIEAVIDPEKFEGVKAALEEAGCTDLMVAEIRHYGKEMSVPQVWRGREYSSPRMMYKIEVVFPGGNKALEKVREVLRAATLGGAGNGKILVYDVTESHPALA